MDAADNNLVNVETGDQLALDGFAKKIRNHANYFDEAGEYERMRDLDAAREIILALKPVVLDMRESLAADGRASVSREAAENLLRVMFG